MQPLHVCLPSIEAEAIPPAPRQDWNRPWSQTAVSEQQMCWGLRASTIIIGLFEGNICCWSSFYLYNYHMLINFMGKTMVSRCPWGRSIENIEIRDVEGSGQKLFVNVRLVSVGFSTARVPQKPLVHHHFQLSTAILSQLQWYPYCILILFC